MGALWLLGGAFVPQGERPSPPASADGSPPPADMKPPPAAANGHAPAIFDTVYAFLKDSKPERPGYGLYSYALITAESPRAKRFLAELFRTTIAADDSRVEPKRLNIVYLPVRDAWNPSWRPKTETLYASAEEFLHEAYDFPLAQKLLSQLCAAPAETVREMCQGDLSRGPYLLTYVSPISTVPQFPPPYLVLDLSDVHEAAFGEFIAAYKTQIKRTDYTDRERIDTFRLELLKIVVPAANWVGPVVKAVSDILHTVND
jgi:hypothetical protein